MIFEVGDILEARNMGLPNGNDYSITNSGGLYRIKQILNKEMIHIDIIAHMKKEYIGRTYDVEVRRFVRQETQDKDNQI